MLPRVHQGLFIDNIFASFQQYCLVPAEIVAKVTISNVKSNHLFIETKFQIPDNITLEQASTLPLGLATAAEGLYGNGTNRVEEKIDRLTPFPWEAEGQGVYNGQTIVVIGGSTSVGQYGSCTVSISSSRQLSSNLPFSDSTSQTFRLL